MRMVIVERIQVLLRQSLVVFRIIQGRGFKVT